MDNYPDFKIPSFLEGNTVDEIHGKMLEAMPNDYDKSQLSIPWDFTRPSAIEISQFAQFTLVESIKSIFPMYAYGTLLDYHAFVRNLERKQAEYATVVVSVTGKDETEIPQGFKFSTLATYTESAIEFQSIADVLIVDGTAEVPCIAVLSGINGNVAIGTITLQSVPLNGIDSVINNEPSLGGTDEETDDALRERIVEFDQNSENSFVGSIADYKRWAEEVNGVGNALIVPPTDDSGVILIIVTDTEGNPASQDILDNVYDYIMRPNAPLERLSPINAQIAVSAPTTVEVTVSATVIITDGADIATIKSNFLNVLKNYLIEENEAVKINYIGSLLFEVDGVEDYSNLLLNGSTVNISLTGGETAITDESKVVLTVG